MEVQQLMKQHAESPGGTCTGYMQQQVVYDPYVTIRECMDTQDAQVLHQVIYMSTPRSLVL